MLKVELAQPVSMESEMASPLRDVQIYHHSDEIPASEWQSVIQPEHTFMCLDYLRGLESAQDSGLELRYGIFRADGKCIGAAVFQITHFTTSDEAYSNRLLSWTNRLIRWVRCNHVHNILICGNAIATGEHGFSFLPGIEQDRIGQLVVEAMDQISSIEKIQGKPICAMVVKDFYPTSLHSLTGFEQRGFKLFEVDHNMVMPIPSDWVSFEDYLNALNTKFRTKAKSALSKSATLNVRELNADEMLEHSDRLNELYLQVHERADFRLGTMDMKSLPSLAASLDGKFHVVGFFDTDHLVGFQTAMICGGVLEAHVIGLDYALNRDLAIYQRMLYEYVRLAIITHSSKIVFGRTAAEIKSTVGAFPVNLHCGFKHRRRISNALLSRILDYVKPSAFPMRHPYRKEALQQQLILLGQPMEHVAN